MRVLTPGDGDNYGRNAHKLLVCLFCKPPARELPNDFTNDGE